MIWVPEMKIPRTLIFYTNFLERRRLMMQNMRVRKANEIICSNADNSVLETKRLHSYAVMLAFLLCTPK